jgi:hypothetical protein
MAAVRVVRIRRGTPQAARVQRASALEPHIGPLPLELANSGYGVLVEGSTTSTVRSTACAAPACAALVP